MSDALDALLDRAEVLSQSPYINGEASWTEDAVSGSRAADSRRQLHLAVVNRALANLTSADTPGLLGPAPAAQIRVAAEAPVLAQLAGPLAPRPGRPEIPTWPTVAAVIDPAQKTLISTPVVGSSAQPATLRTSAAAIDLSFQLQDWAASGADYDAMLSASVLAALEHQLLLDLGAGGQAAADVSAALTACSPAASHVLTNMGDALTGLAQLGQLAVAGLGLSVIVTPNVDGMIVLSRPAVTLAASSVQIGREPEPALLGVGVAAYAYGLAGSSVAAAVQVVG